MLRGRFTLLRLELLLPVVRLGLGERDLVLYLPRLVLDALYAVLDLCLERLA